jgi:hypothetical protein
MAHRTDGARKWFKQIDMIIPNEQLSTLSQLPQRVAKGLLHQKYRHPI